MDIDVLNPLATNPAINRLGYEIPLAKIFQSTIKNIHPNKLPRDKSAGLQNFVGENIPIDNEKHSLQQIVLTSIAMRFQPMDIDVLPIDIEVINPWQLMYELIQKTCPLSEAGIKVSIKFTTGKFLS
jgi:hypothetical protein